MKSVFRLISFHYPQGIDLKAMQFLVYRQNRKIIELVQHGFDGFCLSTISYNICCPVERYLLVTCAVDFIRTNYSMIYLSITDPPLLNKAPSWPNNKQFGFYKTMNSRVAPLRYGRSLQPPAVDVGSKLIISDVLMNRIDVY